MDMDNTLAVKLPVMDVPARACMELKKLTGLPLGEVKRRAAADEFLYVCDYVDGGGLKLINKIKREMREYGIVVRLYEDGEESTSELFDNIERLHDEIDGEYW
ncbi:hypothetical protein [Collinsella sp. D33t1_170424_A12]|uniref:hypothetical protein n=1 Tax=Collinsella sp. D33t1_170424_A12 TaxID=2787135 RepID=UPI00189A6B9E|nr:hypothetical protein [Collinsella sp. D33t1_170424_A12]